MPPGRACTRKRSGPAGGSSAGPLSQWTGRLPATYAASNPGAIGSPTSRMSMGRRRRDGVARARRGTTHDDRPPDPENDLEGAAFVSPSRQSSSRLVAQLHHRVLGGVPSNVGGDERTTNDDGQILADHVPKHG